MRIFVCLFFLFISNISYSYAQQNSIDEILVDKSERSLWLISKGKKLYHFKISLGSNPIGHKQKEGDNKTPEGKYVIDMKKENSSYYKALHISYPNQADKLNAKENGYSAGGMIMIHGQKNGFGFFENITQYFDWTQGCIAVKNADMEIIYQVVKVETPIIIKP